MNTDTRLAFGPKEAAETIGSSRDTIDRLIERGHLKSFTVGRRRFITAEELRRFIREREEASE